jgi:mannose-6-phosphate isomerase-like protein (cupin superfamily)
MNKSGDPITKPTIILPDEGDYNDFGGTGGVHWKIDGDDTGQRFSVVHHPIPPRVLMAPLHYHHNEDEYSFVLEGRMGALLGDDVVEAGPGTWVYKPRKQWHSFWNAGDTPCLIIEVISPAGFENYFREVAEVWGGDIERVKEINDKYSIEMDFDSIPGLCERFGLRVPEKGS